MIISPVLVLLLLGVRCKCQGIDSATIASGTLFLDDQGNEVHMHGLGALMPGSHPHGDNSGRLKYYFVGSTAKRQHVGADASVFWLSQGVNLYSTYNLMDWHLEGLIFQNASITTPIPPGELETSVYRIERPKLVYAEFVEIIIELLCANIHNVITDLLKCFHSLLELMICLFYSRG